MHMFLPSERLGNLLGALALSVTDRVQEALGAEIRSRGLSSAAALIHLRLRPGQTIDSLARVVGISHPAAVRLVDRLEGERVVERRPGSDRRSRAVFLTPEGEDAAVRILGRRLAELEAIIQPLSVRDRRQLERLIAKLLTGLTEDRATARHICRLCDFPLCASPSCPVDQAAARSS